MSQYPHSYDRSREKFHARSEVKVYWGKKSIGASLRMLLLTPIMLSKLNTHSYYVMCRWFWFGHWTFIWLRIVVLGSSLVSRHLNNELWFNDGILLLVLKNANYLQFKFIWLISYIILNCDLWFAHHQNNGTMIKCCT